MSIRFLISIIVFMMVQSVVFGIGTVLVLATPLSTYAMMLMPWVVGLSMLVSAPLAWMIAPYLRAKYANRRGVQPGPVVASAPRQ